MQKINYMRIIAILAFLALAGFSCFWTAESLYVWQPNMTYIGAWLIAVVFYIIASICFSRFLKGFERNTYFEPGLFSSRGGHIFWGLLGLIVFWLCISLPTNTHTLLYRTSIGNILTGDLSRTQNYLNGLKNNNLKIKEYEAEYQRLENGVESYFRRMLDEMDRPGHVGIGERFNTIVAELNTFLGSKIQQQQSVGTSRQQWLNTYNYYHAQAVKELTLKRAERDKKIAEVKRQMNSKDLERLIANTKIAQSDIFAMKGINNTVIKAAVDDLNKDYAYIKANSPYISFQNGDSVRYCREGAIPEAQEMNAVYTVWKDAIFTDKYKGHDFFFWVFIAFVVDIAAFIFFNMATKPTNNAY